MADDVVYDGLLLDRSHVVVELCGVALAEAPESIDLAVVVNKDAGIESELCLNGILIRTPGALGGHEHDGRSAVLSGVHVEGVALLNDVGCVEIASVGGSVADAVTGPVGGIFNGR